MTAPEIDECRGRVQADWIDYNGHMNLAYYLHAFEIASGALVEALGLVDEAAGCAPLVTGAHVGYEKELMPGAPWRVASRIVAAGDGSLHLFQEMRHDAEGWRSAIAETVLEQRHLASLAPRPFPAAAGARLAALATRHAALPTPPELGRVVALTRRPR